MCTNLRIKSKSNDVVIGRTMDLYFDLKSQLTFFPQSTSFTSRAPEGKNGLTWQGKYAFLGLNSLGADNVSDGINECGLYFGALYLPGFTKCQKPSPEQYNETIGNIDVGIYLLSSAQTVSEAKEIIQKVFVWEEVVPQMNMSLPLHFSIQDKNGNAAVFEYIDGNLKIYDNPLGVLTNAPPFDWHLINLRNYIKLSPNDASSKILDGINFSQLGEGTGMLGLPGDFTPTSRFIRAIVLTQSVFPQPEDVSSTIITILHVINDFDLVSGVERNTEGGKIICDYTQWTTISDLANLRYYVRMHDNPGFIRVGFDDFDLKKPGIIKMDPNRTDWFADIKPR
ncbi:MAG: choloylglycine hydrolase family protein [Patescibacteria group bacterium]|nr:choloylglycine hydrolase family protein [Actinomycetota bacterium]MCL5438645.1 choloylglycine hydrolase family protein [Patescibacteria group bacterium]